MKTLEEIANTAFDAKERVKALAMLNTAAMDYDERKQAHAEYCQALHDQEVAERNLRRAIYLTDQKAANAQPSIEEAQADEPTAEQTPSA